MDQVHRSGTTDFHGSSMQIPSKGGMDLRRGIVSGIGLRWKNSVRSTRTRGCRPNAYSKNMGIQTQYHAAPTTAPPRHERFGFGRRSRGIRLVLCHHPLLGSILFFPTTPLLRLRYNTSESDDSPSTRPRTDGDANDYGTNCWK